MNLSAYLALQRGRATRLAKALNVSPVLVGQWLHRVRPIPLHRCIEIDAATLGLVQCEELRPDKRAFFTYLRNR